MKALRIVGVMVVLALVCISCAATTQGKLYQSAVVTKASAETLYESIYMGYKAGLVSAEDRLEAREAYAKAALAQHELVMAAQAGSKTDQFEDHILIATNALRRLVAKYGL
jgi:hypothetical protein